MLPTFHISKGKTVYQILLLFLMLLFGFTISLYAQSSDIQSAPPAVEVSKTNQPITIDGSLEESAWQEAATLSLAYEHYPEANATSPVVTTCLITYDSNYLYISFIASDPQPETIRAHLMDRDSREKLMRDDHVGFTIDPFNNEQWGLQFRVNPLGVQADAIYSNHRNTTDYSWDGIWESSGTMTEEGYEVEIRIPFSSINTPSGDVQDWRFSAFRNYPRSVQYRVRSHPIDLDEQSLMAQFNEIEGFKDLSTGLNLEINPVITAKKTDAGSGGNTVGLEQGPINLSPGGNLQWGIKPNLNLSATINPDFSQIEADALQLRENRRFVLSFPERRPFFLESSEIFDTPLQAVFTRSIIEPKAGIKMTGKQGAHSFGAFITQDQSSRILFPANQQSQSKILNNRSYSEIFRYQNQFTNRLALGLLGTARQSAGSGYRNYAGGIDGYWQFTPSNTLQFQYLQSNTQYSDEISEDFNQQNRDFNGNALYLNFNHTSRNWAGQASYTSVSSGFRNDNGFFPRADLRTYQAAGQHIVRGSSDSWFSSIRFGPAFELITDQSGLVTDRTISLAALYRGPLQSEIVAEYHLSRQRFSGRMFSGMNTGVFFFRLQPSGFLSKFRAYTAYGETVDFSNRRIARQIIFHPGITFDINRNLNFEIDPNYQRLSYEGNTTFTTYLLGLRAIYHFNKQTFFRSILQYRYVDRNLNEFNNPEAFESSSESFFYQLLFSYKINPQSKVFLGYSSGYDGINETPLRIQNRTGYLKIGYAWVF